MVTEHVYLTGDKAFRAYVNPFKDCTTGEQLFHIIDLLLKGGINPYMYGKLPYVVGSEKLPEGTLEEGNVHPDAMVFDAIHEKGKELLYKDARSCYVHLRKLKPQLARLPARKLDITEGLQEIQDCCALVAMENLTQPTEQKKDEQGSGGKAVGTKRKIDAIRDQVFISYSHKDERWLDELQTHLKPYVRNGSVTAWSDEQIPPGAEWFEEIKRALSSTKVAVLLVTKDFVASEFIREHELTPLLKEAEKGDVRIIWIPVRACSYKETMLKDYQAAINPEKPLANMKKADRDKAWVGICKGIKKGVSR